MSGPKEFKNRPGVPHGPSHGAAVPDAAMQSIAGHLSKKMLDHYSDIRMAAKRQAVAALGGGLMVNRCV